jgi:hypothetical protein
MPHGTTQSLNHSSSPLRRVDCAARLQAGLCCFFIHTHKPKKTTIAAAMPAGWRVLLSSQGLLSHVLSAEC